MAEGLEKYTTEELVAEVQKRILAFHDMEAGFLRLLGQSSAHAPSGRTRAPKGYTRMSAAKAEFWKAKREQAAKQGITLSQLIAQERASKKASKHTVVQTETGRRIKK